LPILGPADEAPAHRLPPASDVGEVLDIWQRINGSELGERRAGFLASPALGDLVQFPVGVLRERGRRLYQAHDRLLLNDWAAECAVPGLTDLPDAGDLRKVLARTGESARRLVAAAVAAVPDEGARGVLERRLGLSGGGPQTLAQIGAHLGISRERVRQRADRAVKAIASGRARTRAGAENPVTLPDLDVRIIAAHAGGSLLGSLCGKGRGFVMAGEGSVFRRCGCVDPVTGRQYGRRCPRLGAGGRHGSWYVRLELPGGLDGRRRRIRRGGYPSRRAALEVLARLRNPRAGETGGIITVGDWLAHWLVSRTSPAASTVRGYAAHVRLYLGPYLGEVLLTELTVGQVQAMFTAIIRQHQALGTPLSAATLTRVRATLRAALNAAIRRGLITDNPAARAELPRARRPRAVVWTPYRVGQWRRSGERPAVAVWTARQTGQFLDSIRWHRLYAAYHLIALRGLRRGEAAGAALV
jgi:sigma-70-like protein